MGQPVYTDLAMDQIRIRLRVAYDGATPASVGWPDLREIVDLAVDALCALGELQPSEVHVLDMQTGSLVPVFGVPARARAAAQMLARGPTRRWSAEQRQRVEPLYAFARERSATLQIGARRLSPVLIPDPTESWALHERAELPGRVMRVGGNKGRVRIDFELDGPLVCDAGRDLSRELAKYLYQNVVVTGDTRRDPVTHALLGMTILGAQPANKKSSTAEAFRLIDEAVGGAGVGFDVLGAVRESRR